MGTLEGRMVPEVHHDSKSLTGKEEASMEGTSDHLLGVIERVRVVNRDNKFLSKAAAQAPCPKRL